MGYVFVRVVVSGTYPNQKCSSHNCGILYSPHPINHIFMPSNILRALKNYPGCNVQLYTTMSVPCSTSVDILTAYFSLLTCQSNIVLTTFLLHNFIRKHQEEANEFDNIEEVGQNEAEPDLNDIEELDIGGNNNEAQAWRQSIAMHPMLHVGRLPV